MGRAEKYALIQSQVILWALLLAVAYLLATKVSAVVGVAYLAVMVACSAYIVGRVVRDMRKP